MLEDYFDFADELIGEKGISQNKKSYKGFIKRVTKIEDERLFHKKIGTYISFEFDDEVNEDAFCKEIIATLKSMKRKRKIKKKALVLCFGIGNEQYTSDALGPKTIRKLEPTCHLNKGRKLYGISTMIPGVMAETGLESARTAKALIKEYQVDLVIAIDSLVTHKEERLFKVIQLTDTGITPGSGILSFRKSLNEEYLGVPVFALGVATTISSRALEEALLERINKDNPLNMKEIKDYLAPHLTYYTPKDTDEMIMALSDVLSYCIHEAFK